MWACLLFCERLYLGNHIELGSEILYMIFVHDLVPVRFFFPPWQVNRKRTTRYCSDRFTMWYKKYYEMHKMMAMSQS